MHINERSVSDARVNLSKLIRDANNAGTVTYLTSNGLRVAAIVPVAIADAAADSTREAA